MIMRRKAALLEWDQEGLTTLHAACLRGQLASIEGLVGSGLVDVDDRCPRGRRPIHSLLSFQSAPHTSLCLQYLLKHGADANAATQTGQTPLHLAATGGLRECAEILVRAGADVFARDGLGCTPLDLARFWSRRKTARYLKDCMWKARKREETEKTTIVKSIRQDLVAMAKLNDEELQMTRQVSMAEWANKKGLPNVGACSPRESRQSQYHTQCFLSPRSDAPPTKPDLKGTVALFKDSSGQPWLTTKWHDTPLLMPDLSLDVLEREIFLKAFPSRINSPSDFQPRNVLDLPHLGRPRGQRSFPATEVPMHLAEVLEVLKDKEDF